MYYKFQKNKGGLRVQRIRNGKVKIQFQSMQQVVGLSILVQRLGSQSSSPVSFPKDSITISQQKNNLQVRARKLLQDIKRL